MPKQIILELSKASCQKALRELEKYQKEIKPKLEEVCKRLAEIGAQEANTRIIIANGNTDAKITTEQMSNGYKLLMSGADVYFIEFGTGDAANANGYSVSVPVYPGSYSEQNAERYSTYGFWWYGGEKLTETPAYMPLYYAGKKMRDEMPRIIKEVFGK